MCCASVLGVCISPWACICTHARCGHPSSVLTTFLYLLIVEAKAKGRATRVRSRSPRGSMLWRCSECGEYYSAWEPEHRITKVLVLHEGTPQEQRSTVRVVICNVCKLDHF